jgi:response regulator RpfG family c-di-GMP phosphodiesterase
MKNKIYIFVVEDEPEVLDAIVRDLEEFETTFPIEMADSAEEARELIDALINAGNEIGVILCDHVLPGQNGVDLMVEMQNDPKTSRTRKVLITGQAGLDETVRAVNEADLQHYIAKPWEKSDLVETTRKFMTDYVLKWADNPMEYMSVLDGQRIADYIRKGKGITDN